MGSGGGGGRSSSENPHRLMINLRKEDESHGEAVKTSHWSGGGQRVRAMEREKSTKQTWTQVSCRNLSFLQVTQGQ